MGAAAAWLPRALGPAYRRRGARDVAYVVGGHRLIDPLQPPFVEFGLDEQPDLELVELGNALHPAMIPAPIAATREDPEGFPRVLRRRGRGPAVYRRVCAVHGGKALLERERELEALAAGLDRACAGDGTLLLVQGRPA